jgi:hypothetical protein
MRQFEEFCLPPRLETKEEIAAHIIAALDRHFDQDDYEEVVAAIQEIQVAKAKRRLG